MATILIKQELPEKEREEVLITIKKQFGKLIKEDIWGTRDLSYPILHSDKAYYAHYEFEGEPFSISSLDKSLKLNEDIIRYLIIRN